MLIHFSLMNESEFVSIGGLVTSVILITHTLRYAFNWSARWIGLLVSTIVSVVGTCLTTERDIKAWILAICNIFIIYILAAGVAEFLSAIERSPETSGGASEEIGAVSTRRFGGSWFR